MAHVVSFYFSVFVWIFYDLASTPVCINANAITDDLSFQRHQSFQFPVQYPHSYVPASEVARPRIGKDDVHGTSPYKHIPYFKLPMFQHATGPLLDPGLFRPVAGSRPLPSGLSRLLFPSVDSPVLNHITPVRNPSGVEVWCGYNKIYVRVDRYQVGFRCQPSLLFLGACPVYRVTPQFLYFDYDLNACSSSIKMQGGQLVYSNFLRYSPEPQGPVLRAVPLTLPIQCFYSRFHYAYKVGYQPQVFETTFFKSVRSKRIFHLTACNAQWEALDPEENFVLGEPLFFQASATFLSTQERLYIDSCFVTPTKDPNTLPRMDIIDNYGCMLDSKREGGSSQFYSRDGSFLRFSMDAFLFPYVDVNRLFLHCNMTVASSVPKASAKSCTFSNTEGRWTELEASPSVCSCCESQCKVEKHWPTSMSSAVRSLVSSSVWGMGVDGGKKQNRRRLSFQAEEGREDGVEETREKEGELVEYKALKRPASKDKGEVVEFKALKLPAGKDEGEVVEFKALKLPAGKDEGEVVEFKALKLPADKDEEVTSQGVKVSGSAREVGHKVEKPKQQESRGNETGEEVHLGAAARRENDDTDEKEVVVVGEKSTGQLTTIGALEHAPAVQPGGAGAVVPESEGDVVPEEAGSKGDVVHEGMGSEGAEVRSGNRTEVVQGPGSSAVMTTTVSPSGVSLKSLDVSDGNKTGTAERGRVEKITVESEMVPSVKMGTEGVEVRRESSVRVGTVNMVGAERVEKTVDMVLERLNAEVAVFLQGSQEPAEWRDDP